MREEDVLLLQILHLTNLEVGIESVRDKISGAVKIQRRRTF